MEKIHFEATDTSGKNHNGKMGFELGILSLFSSRKSLSEEIKSYIKIEFYKRNIIVRTNDICLLNY